MCLNKVSTMVAVFGVVAVGLAVFGGIGAASATTVNIPAVKDNTIFDGPTGNSNGAGDFFFVGSTNTGMIRRALIAFRVADSIPAGSTVTAVTLTLHMSKTISAGETVSLHRLTADWGEGTSNAGASEGTGAPATTGDATWLFRFFNTLTWTAQGGDFSTQGSASQTVTAVGFYSWTSAQMIADVQGWVNGPNPDFGWILIDNEGVSATAKRFDSRTNPTVADRPVLTVTFTPGSGIEPGTFGEIKALYK